MGSSLQQVLVTGKDLKCLNSILSDCFSLLPAVLGLFYKPSYLDHLCVWNPDGLTPRSSHFLCEDSKFRHRTLWPVDHKLFSQNKFIMPLGKTFTTGMAKVTCSNAIHFYVEIALCKFSMYRSPSHSQMAEDWYINAALTSLQAHSELHSQMQGISFTTSSLLTTHLLFQLPADPKAPSQPPSESSSKATLSLHSLTSICPYYFPRKAHHPLLPRLQVSQGGTEDG